MLQGISFSISEGQKVVLVGNSGSGKSTCLKLIHRFYDVQQGTVEYNSFKLSSHIYKIIPIIKPHGNV